MRKGYYIYFTSSTIYAGVDKKVDNQIKVFQRYFDIDKISVEKEKTNFFKSLVWRLPFGSYGRKYNNAFCQINNPDFIYIRFAPVDRRFIFFIKSLKEKYPTCEIIMEVATFPYKKELLSNFEMVPFYFKDALYHRFLKKYVNYITTFSTDSKIFDIPTIQIRNGIIVDDITPIKGKRHGDVINLLAVATFQKSHGYERIIKGIYEYYKKPTLKKIKLLLVGDGDEIGYYKELVERYRLESHVTFYGRKTGKELDEIYEMADIGLSSFGAYKRKIERSSALKVREYLAKGLPVITGCYEDVLDMGESPYIYSFPNNGTIISMEDIVDFYNKIYEDSTGNLCDQIHMDIRKYAKKVVDMNMTMKPVIQHLLEKK